MEFRSRKNKGRVIHYPLKVHITKRGKYVRIRIKNPKRFVKSSFRTQDIGRKGHSKRIAGLLKSRKKWATQSILITKKDFKNPRYWKKMKKRIMQMKRRR